MAFIDYKSELVGAIPDLNILYAGTLVNRAYQEIRDARLWTWLLAEDAFYAPSPIASGTVAVTQFSSTVVADSVVAAPLLQAAAFATPPLTSRQFRVTGDGSIYNITAYNPGTNTITLDRVFEGPTNATANYQVYRCYYAPSNNDFLQFRSIVNPNQAFSISGSRLAWDRQDIDRRDPQRSSQGDAYFIATYKIQSTGVPLYEFWPHPINANVYNILYSRRGVDMVADSDDIPMTLGKSVLMENALSKGCEWAAKNVGRFPNLRGVNWGQIIKEHNAKFERELARAKKQDDEIFLMNYISPWKMDRNIGPIDGAFIQSHDIFGGVGG